MRQSLPYFRDEGWEPVVLAVDPAFCTVPLDPLLARTFPADIRVVRTRALDARMTRRFGLGSLDLRALPFMTRAGDQLLAEEPFDLVYFSTTTFALTALGPRWMRRFGVPYVIDMQDPWRTDYYSRPEAPPPPGGRFKYAFTRLLARLLEPHVMRHVSHVISVSPAYPEMLRTRYPWMRPEQFTVLPFGAAEQDFEQLNQQPVAQSVFDPDDGYEHWVYVGAAGGIMRFSLTAFFAALAEARRDDPERFARLRIHFVGTTYASDDRVAKTVEPVAVACGVGDLIEERPHRIPYFEALQCLLDADALLMPGSDDPSYTASKLYPYILARRPLLAIFHEHSSVLEVIEKTGAGVAVPFATGEAVSGVATRIRRAWFDRVPLEAPKVQWEAFAPYSSRAMTQKQVEVFEGVVGQVPSHA